MEAEAHVHGRRSMETITCVGCKQEKTGTYWIKNRDGEKLCGPCGQRYNKYVASWRVTRPYSTPSMLAEYVKRYGNPLC